MSEEIDVRDARRRERSTRTYRPRTETLAPAAAAFVLLLAPCAAPAAEASREGPKEGPPRAACTDATGPGPAEVVKALYREYPFESPKVPENEPLEILRKYFDDRLAALFVKDRECTEKTGDLCKLTATVLYAAQDADIRDFHVCAPAPGSDWVEARFLNFGKPEVIRFEVKKTPRGWRVADIRYEGDREGLVKGLADP